MTAAETYMDGHGVFRASASYTEPDTNFGPPAPWKAFSKDTESQTTGWSGSNDHNAVTGSNPGEYNGTNQLASSTPLGEWLKIELPHKIKLNSYALKPLGIANRYGVADYPKTFYIYGSNDGSSWELIDSRVNTSKTPQILGAAVASNETITYSISNNGLAYYDKYAIVITKINSEAVYAVDNTVAATYLAIGEWRLFGTRQGQSTLHDGELKLTKNLTVPRIGPALDADDTPRRDRLVVEYNTSTNPTENGTVRDTSGRGLDGLIRGSASYDATEKAFNIVASSDILTTGTNIGGVSGDFLASVSLWFKPSTVTSATSQILFIHTSAYAAAASFLVNIYEDQIAVGHGSTNNSYKDGSLVANEWYHVVAIKKGTGAVSNNIYEIYLNGTKLALTNGAGTDVMNVSSDQAIIIGGAREVAVNTEQFVGKISNVKYYPGIVLTTEEAKRLYDMGRLGNVIAQPVHIAAPLQVEKTLRVPIDGTTLGTTGMIRFNTSSGRLQVHDGTTWSTIGNTIATGGTVTNSGGYTIHTFTSSGNFTVYVGGDVEYLVVAGGGGGGYDGGGGGGAGGLLTGTVTNLTPGTYTITVGEGGAASTSVGSQAGNGTDSSIETLVVATGGGGGGAKTSAGAGGGSGGGGGHGGASTYAGGTATASPSQGRDGGDGASDGGGGGGGAGAVGADASSATNAGNGGIGLKSSISGTSAYYAGGGGGGTFNTDVEPGTGGLGGGGDGGGKNESVNPSTPGDTNTGGGGGADGIATGGGASDGGSGIVIIRYLS
jgi:hypothetical protein